jgi:hypothetical protein
MVQQVLTRFILHSCSLWSICRLAAEPVPRAVYHPRTMLHLNFLLFFVPVWMSFLRRSLLLASIRCSWDKRDGSGCDKPEASPCFDGVEACDSQG